MEVLPQVVDSLSAPTVSLGGFLQEIAGYEMREEDPAELKASLSHSPVTYQDVRRWVVVDPAGLVQAEIVALAFQEGAASRDLYLEHQFGDAERTPVRINGTLMHWVDARPHRVLVWDIPGALVTFGRGQEVTEEWLIDLAEAVEAARSG